MVKDRTEEFRERAKLTKVVTQNINSPKNTRVTESTTFLHRNTVEAFLERIGSLKERMSNMEDCLILIREIHDAILRSSSVDHKLSHDLNIRVEAFKTHSHAINNSLKAINDEVSPDFEPNETNYRIKKSHLLNISQKFRDLMIEFNGEQVRYREKSQQRMRNYLKISGVEMDDDAIDEAIESGRIFDTVSVLMAERDKKALFEDVKNRHEDIVKLEASIRELHEIFQDMTMMIGSQGEMMNNIEKNVETAVVKVEKAERHVKYARESRNRNIWLTIGATICAIILICILILVGLGLIKLYVPSVF